MLSFIFCNFFFLLLTLVKKVKFNFFGKGEDNAFESFNLRKKRWMTPSFKERIQFVEFSAP